MKYEYRIQYQIGTAKKNRKIISTSFITDRNNLSYREMKERIGHKGIHIKTRKITVVGFSIAAWAAFFIA